MNSTFAKQHFEYCFLYVTFVSIRCNADVNLEIEVRKLWIHSVSFATGESIAVELTFKINSFGGSQRETSFWIWRRKQRQPTSSPPTLRAGPLNPIELLNSCCVVFFTNCTKRFIAKRLWRNVTRFVRRFRINCVENTKRIGNRTSKIQCERIEVV